MTVPQPFQYQGSKRALAPLILQYLSGNTLHGTTPIGGTGHGTVFRINADGTAFANIYEKSR